MNEVLIMVAAFAGFVVGIAIAILARSRSELLQAAWTEAARATDAMQHERIEAEIWRQRGRTYAQKLTCVEGELGRLRCAVVDVDAAGVGISVPLELLQESSRYFPSKLGNVRVSLRMGAGK